MMIMILIVWRCCRCGDVDDVFDDNDNKCDDDDDGVVDNIGLMMMIKLNSSIL